MLRSLTIAAAIVAATTATASASCKTTDEVAAFAQQHGMKLVSEGVGEMNGAAYVIRTYAQMEAGVWVLLVAVPMQPIGGGDVQYLWCLNRAGIGFELMPVGDPT